MSRASAARRPPMDGTTDRATRSASDEVIAASTAFPTVFDQVSVHI